MSCCEGKAAGFTHLVGQRIGTEIFQGKLELSILIFAADDDFDSDRHIWRRCRGGGSHGQLCFRGAVSMTKTGVGR